MHDERPGSVHINLKFYASQADLISDTALPDSCNYTYPASSTVTRVCSVTPTDTAIWMQASDTSAGGRYLNIGIQ